MLAVRPAQILKSPAAELMPTEVLQAALAKETGIDPLGLEQLVVCAVAPMGMPPSYSLMAAFDGPLALKPSPLTRHTELGTLNGKEYMKSKELMAPSIYMVDDQTLLAAPEFALPQLLNPSAAAPGALAAQVAAAAQGDDVIMLLDLEPLRTLIQMGMQQAQKDIPPELAEVVQIPGLVKTIEMRLNFSHPAVTEGIVAANNEADAQKLVSIFKSVKKAIAAKAEQEFQQALASDDPVEQASRRYSQRMSKYWQSNLQLQRDGNRLVLFHIDPAQGPQSQLMTVAVVGVLVALLLPAIQAAREAARRNVSLNNIRQIMIALLNHEAARKRLPAQANYGPDGKPLLSWRVHILPYIEQAVLYKQFHLDEPWDSEHNKQLIPLMPEVYRDPSSKLTASDGRTHYLGAAGEGMIFDPKIKDGRSLRTITDGTSNTIAIVQVDDSHAVEWTRPDDWELDENEPFAGLGRMHPGNIFLAGFCDGHVIAVSTSVELSVLKALVSAAGGEPLGGGF